MTRPHARPVPVPLTMAAKAARWWLGSMWGAALLSTLGTACAADELAAVAPSGSAASAPIANSALDAPMFYQLLVGEMEAQAGRQTNAYEVMLDAAKRSRDGALFQRAVELGVQMRSGDKALAAAKAWRSAMPDSIEATRTMVQMLVALDKPGELAEPLRALLQQVPAEDRGAVIAGVPRFLENSTDKGHALAAAEQALAPYVQAEPTRTAARVALGRLALAADKPDQALSLARRALADDPAAPGPALLALELMPREPSAEVLVQASLARPEAPPAIRMAYARTLEQRQRLVEAISQMRQALQQQPELPQGWLSLGAALLDLHETREATEALQRALQQVDAEGAASATGEAASADTDDDTGGIPRAQRMRELIWQLLAQAAELRGDDRAVMDWLGRIPPARTDLQTLVRQAAVMARQGKLAEARTLAREGVVSDNPDARARLLAEAQVLRSVKHWQEAYDLLLTGVRQTPADTGLLYELAMMAERLNRFDDMEALLRRALNLKPDDPQALNALGYSLADRNLRLDEASSLIKRATELAPGDPFIADSLGWLEFRLGHREQALQVLRQAYGRRPHVEVAAHLGEVLWADDRREEALKVWRDGAARDDDNEVLRDTLNRLKVQL